MLYLVKVDLLSIPILYLSRYINHNKADYYQLLQTVRETNEWEEWILFLLEGVEQISNDGIQLILDIKQQMQSYKHILRTRLPKIYSQDLLNNIFRHPYTKIEFVVNELGVTRATAAKYLDELVSTDLLKKVKLGRDNYYINIPLFNLLGNVSQTDNN